MKSKIFQLVLVLLMISLFSSSKTNSGKLCCSAGKKCNESAAQTVNAITEEKEKSIELSEYPFSLSPGSYMFRY